MKNILKSEYALALAIILIGIGLNIFLSAHTSFWIDESTVVNLSYESNAKIISELLTKDVHPPIYYFLIKSVRIILGDKESYFRLISSLFFGLTGIYIFLLGRAVGGQSTGLISLVGWSSNYFLLFYSKQARPYSLLAFLSIASFYYFYCLFKTSDRKNIVFYLLFTIIGLYTNYWFALLLATQLIILCATDRKNKKIWLALIGAGLAFLPWAIFYLINFKNYGIGEYINKPGLKMLWESLGYFGWGQWLFILIGVICGAMYGIVKKNIDFKKLDLLACYFFVPIILAFVISQFIPIYTPGRRELIAAPAFIIAIAYLFSRIQNKWWQISISATMMLLTSQTILNFNAQAHSWKSSDLSLMQEIKTQAEDNDYFILYGLTNTNVSYYARRLGLNNKKIYFPSDMEFNQNSLEPTQQLSTDNQKLDQGLNKLKNVLSQTDQNKFFVFLTDDAATATIIDFLNLNFKKMREIIPENPHMPTWINRVIIYEKKY
jgi:uncharacterized membrane protein